MLTAERMQTFRQIEHLVNDGDIPTLKQLAETYVNPRIEFLESDRWCIGEKNEYNAQDLADELHIVCTSALESAILDEVWDQLEQ